MSVQLRCLLCMLILLNCRLFVYVLNLTFHISRQVNTTTAPNYKTLLRFFYPFYRTSLLFPTQLIIYLPS